MVPFRYAKKGRSQMGCLVREPEKRRIRVDAPLSSLSRFLLSQLAGRFFSGCGQREVSGRICICEFYATHSAVLQLSDEPLPTFVWLRPASRKNPFFFFGVPCLLSETFAEVRGVGPQQAKSPQNKTQSKGRRKSPQSENFCGRAGTRKDPRISGLNTWSQAKRHKDDLCFSSRSSLCFPWATSLMRKSPRTFVLSASG
jgi:hypothetical protein